MLWIKKSKVVVDCFTSNVQAYELFPIGHALAFLPEWWLNAPKEYEVRGLFPASTIKRCPAVINTFKHGLMIPLWSDLAIVTRGGTNWEVKFSDPETSIEPHDSKQWDFYADPKDYMHMKLMSPWHVSTKHGISWTYSKPMWNFPADDNLFIAPGIVDFKSQHSTNINILLSLEPKPAYVIKAGQPMVHMVPLTEKQIEVKHHLLTEEEFKQKHRNKFSFAFTRGQIRAERITKEKKCPFSL